MIMQQIDLYDTIVLTERNDKQIVLRSNCDYIPRDEGNIAFRAAALIRKRFNINKGIEIEIDKQIPVAAGLAGGSTNAAAVLRGLNQLWQLGLSREEMMALGVNLGADVPFCVLGGAAHATGIGESLTPVQGLKNLWLVIAKPSISVSTAEVYAQLNLSKLGERPDTKKMLELIAQNDISNLAKNMRNVLETVTEVKYPVIREIKGKMMEYNALGCMMTGSGPTVFGIYKNYERAKSAYENLALLYKQTYMVQTYCRREEDE